MKMLKQAVDIGRDEVSVFHNSQNAEIEQQDEHHDTALFLLYCCLQDPLLISAKLFGTQVLRLSEPALLP